VGGEAPRNPVGPPIGRPATGAAEAADQLHLLRKAAVETKAGLMN